ncbi:MAG: flagellar FliJ family protein [Candidatus Eisenbacteria bacterium]|uniref:Flagellar FliJ protein n=1 Tax=Eiseniibacteriota bacterium TaxID=2212470 RepID=A0A956NCH7_UNCEI|nr:flagellar FliJ family protein [Candidatus Eisenbacteria bacterium]
MERPEGDASALSIWEIRRQWLREEIGRLDGEVTRANEATSFQRGRLEDAERRRQVVDRIRERQRLEYVREMLKEEQRELDEIAGQADYRKAA